MVADLARAVTVKLASLKGHSEKYIKVHEFCVCIVATVYFI